MAARHRAPAFALAAWLLASGPLADARTASAETGTGLHSVWSLSHLRRLSEFTAGLRRALLARHPRLAPGTRVILSNVPPLSLVALRDDAAVQSWYADPSLRAFTLSSGYDAAHPPARFVLLEYEAEARPPRWIEIGPEYARIESRARAARDARREDEEALHLSRLLTLPESRERSPAWRARALARLGYLRHGAGNLAAADSLYLEALAADPAEPRALAGHGLLLLLDPARRAEAEPFLARAVELLPDDPATAYGYGLSLEAHDPDRALRFVERALALGLEGESRALAVREAQTLKRRMGGTAP